VASTFRLIPPHLPTQPSRTNPSTHVHHRIRTKRDAKRAAKAARQELAARELYFHSTKAGEAARAQEMEKKNEGLDEEGLPPYECGAAPRYSSEGSGTSTGLLARRDSGSGGGALLR